MPSKPTATKASKPAVVVPHAPETKVRVTLELSASLFDLYDIQAMENGRLVEEELLQRLQRCREYTAKNPIYMNDEQRSRLERALGHNFASVESAIAQITTATTLQVGDCGVELSPRIAQRVSSRAKAEKKTFEEVIQREVIKGLSVYTGLIPG